LLTGNFINYARSVFLPLQAPGYQNPLMYAFNGIAALLTYLNNSFGWETGVFINYMTPLLILAVIAAVILCYKSRITPAQGALAGFLLLMSLTYRVNYQYLIVYIPLALLVASRTKYRSERILAIVVALLPAAWLWLIDVSFWFNYIYPASPWVRPIFERLGLTHLDLPDYAFVSLAGALTGLFLAYVVCTFTRWRKP
jgi:hypothetical protein